MGELLVRRAAPADAAACARLHVVTWHEAYTGRMPQEVLDGRSVEQVERAWTHNLTSSDNPYSAWVAVRDGEILGIASSADAATDPEDAADGVELGMLYVYAKAYGSGAGQALFDAAVGASASGLWVLDDNPRAQAFYRRNGYAFNGRVKLDDRWTGGAIRELRMTRPAVA